jgi:Xaa-Pro aminopeptidase
MEAARMQKLRQAMETRGLTAVLISNPVNRRYMTGFTGSAGVAVITANDAWLLTDFRYKVQAPMQARYYEVVEHGPKLTDTLRDLLSRSGIRQLGFEQDYVSYGEYLKYKQELPNVELVPVAGIVEDLRQIKDEAELKIMREAAAIADQAFSHILNRIRPGMTEREVALELETFMRANGAKGPSFDTIVASGPRSALPHGTASDKPLAAGELVTFDFGAYYQGYCSDLTRTVMLGKPTEKHREIYEIVREAQALTLERLKPGMSGWEADAVAREWITRAGYGDCFGHGTGHGLGMEIHEAPRLSVTGDIILQPGMVVTVEPGIYIPDFGGVRIEDDVVITDTGIELLTHSDKQWTVIE